MKKILLSFSFVTLFSPLFAQTPITDSAVLGSGYTNDIYYSMDNGVVGTAPGNNWHLGFAIRNAAPPTNVIRSTSVIVNEGRGVRVFESNQSFNNWNTFDTAGYINWSNPHNSDSTWDIGAFNVNRNTTDPFDYGWGEYDMTSHDVSGEKMFLVRITTGSGPSAINTFKKISINKIVFDSQWVFTYANLDNTDSMTVSFDKKDFAGKLFAYYNLVNDSLFDREPDATWDLLFTRYGANATQFGQTIFSTNTGALSYPIVLTSKVTGVPSDDATPTTFTSKITGIGTDWKENPGPGQPNFIVHDSTTYFTKRSNSELNKLVFKSFTGSSTGTIIFEKTFIPTVGLRKLNTLGVVNVYPNPSSKNINIQLNDNKPFTVNITDIAGKTQLSTTIYNLENSINISSLQSGIYFVCIQNDEAQTVVRIIVQ